MVCVRSNCVIWFAYGLSEKHIKLSNEKSFNYNESILTRFSQANIINLECTYYKSYNWNKSETKKPPSDSLSKIR